MKQEKRRRYRTQGIKGARAPRINMAFDPDVYDFIRARAMETDQTMTRYVNEAIRDKMPNRTERIT